MKTRDEFHQALVKALGTPYVYAQKPEGLQTHKGNRIIYSREKIDFQKRTTRSILVTLSIP